MARETPFKPIAIASLFMIALTPSLYASAASFDCKQAASIDEKTICADRTLSEKDVQMTTTYNLLKGLLLMGARGALQDEQGKWLKKRQQCGTNSTCLSQLYDQRIGTLMDEYNKTARAINTD
ncbi:lysozyme inhibitor LprI family protein [Yersinia bercovieri]|uniref:lysozyme inhibitor LprI family protein n=1 Tax=Yersinia bercovieri TaxID=634 RepID=UPI003B972236